MKVAFCTTCKNRTAHLREALPQNLRDNPRALFVIVNYNTEDDLVRYLRDTHGDEIRTGRLILYSYLGSDRFKMAHAKNLAHRCAMLEGADVLVNLDADNMTGPGFEDFVAEQFGQRDDIFLWAHMVKGEMTRGVSGRIAVTARAFVKVGGYDEQKFEGWGSDDKDFHVRLADIDYYGVQIPARYLLAIPHNDKVRFREYPDCAEASDDELFTLTEGGNWARRTLATTEAGGREWHEITKAVVNDGRFGCGEVFRNFDFETPILLGPVPTRIFGVGLHKTSTTSLHEAMGLLGYDSWHWSPVRNLPAAHAAKAIWREMNQTGRSPILDEYHAACDLPIPLLFPKLDEVYPGSKFILTLRDEDSWIESVEKHWNPNINKWRSQWDTDPFTNRVHQVLYGRTDFDRETMLARYRRHNCYVREYFQDRPGDLLVMYNGAGWPDLCGFLGISVPDVPYPHSNHTASAPIEAVPLSEWPGHRRRKLRRKRRANALAALS